MPEYPKVCECLTECMKIIHNSGLEYIIHTHGTNIFDAYDKVCEVGKESINSGHKVGTGMYYRFEIELGTI